MGPGSPVSPAHQFAGQPRFRADNLQPGPFGLAASGRSLNLSQTSTSFLHVRATGAAMSHAIQGARPRQHLLTKGFPRERLMPCR